MNNNFIFGRNDKLRHALRLSRNLDQSQFSRNLGNDENISNLFGDGETVEKEQRTRQHARRIIEDLDN